MPKLPTAEEVFGSRPTPRSQRQIQGYDTSAISQANIRAGAELESVGKSATKAGVNMLEDQRVAREKAQAEREKQIAKQDNLLEAQMRSEFLRESINFDNEIANRTDYQNFETDAQKRFSPIVEKYKGKLSPDAQAYADLWVSDFSVKQSGALKQTVRSKVNNATLAIVDQSKNENLKAMEMAQDDSQFAQLAKDTYALDVGLRDKGIIDDVELGRRYREWEKLAADAYAKRLPPEKLLELTNAALPSGDSNADYTQRVREIESAGSGDLTAKNTNSSAKGRYQWIDKTARQYGLLGDGFDYRGDAEKEEAAFKRFTEDNRIALRASLGREPTDAELYLAHQQGAEGAAKLLSDPSAMAIDVVGRDAVLNNRGTLDMTAGEFANKWLNKYGGGAKIVNKTNTPLDLLDRDYLEKLSIKAVGDIADKMITENPEQFLADLDSGRFSNITANQKRNFQNIAKSEIEKKKEVEEFAILQKDTQQYMRLIDGDANGDLTYSEVMNFMADAGEDQGKLKVGKSLLDKMVRPPKDSELTDFAKVQLLGELSSEYDAIMKTGKNSKEIKPAKGITDFVRFQQRFLENAKHFSYSDLKKFRAIMPVLQQKAQSIDPNSGLFSRADNMAGDEYVQAYDFLDSWLSLNKEFDTPENRLNIISQIVPTSDYLKETQGEVAPNMKVQQTVAGKIIRDYISTIAPEYAGLEKLPKTIMLNDGTILDVPENIAGMKAEFSISTAESLKDSYTLKDGTVMPKEDLINLAKELGTSTDDLLKSMRARGQL